MDNLLIGLSVAGGLLGWVIYRYFVAKENDKKAAIEKRLKEEKYRLVLEKARLAEREEKIFKAQTGHVPSQLSLAKEYELTNIREALQWYTKAALLDNDIAQNALARLCSSDSNDPLGEAKSAYWTQVVKAKHNDPIAKFELGSFQLRGYGTDVDEDAGIANITAAAESDYLPAMLLLGDWYLADTTSQKKPEEAFLWRLRAALLGDNKACIKTAYCYQAGIAVAKNRLRAVYWLERAAEQGDTEAQYLVAKMLGEGGETDKAVAYIWLSLAYAGGNRDAKVLRDNVVQYIGVDAIVGVQNVANTIYRVMRQGNVKPHGIINLLDQVYGREGYRPDEENLARLAAGDLSSEQAVEPDDSGLVKAETTTGEGEYAGATKAELNKNDAIDKFGPIADSHSTELHRQEKQDKPGKRTHTSNSQSSTANWDSNWSGWQTEQGDSFAVPDVTSPRKPEQD